MVLMALPPLPPTPMTLMTATDSSSAILNGMTYPQTPDNLHIPSDDYYIIIAYPAKNHFSHFKQVS
jgi:hypothetical protein